MTCIDCHRHTDYLMIKMHLKCVIFCAVFIVCDVSGTTSVGSFDRIDCPATPVLWTERSDEKNCPTGTQYHCLFNQNGVTGEVCVKESWVQPGYCPLFDTKSQRINVKKCSPFDSLYCPLDPFLSNDVRKHEICLTKPSPTTMRVPLATTEAVSKKNDTGGGGSAAVIVVVIILVLVIVVVVLFLLIRRRNGLFPGTQWKVPFWDVVESVIGKNDQQKPDSGQKENDVEERLLSEENQHHNDIGFPTTLSLPIIRSNPKFVETSLYKDLLQQVKENDVVIVYGTVGLGKTASCIGVTEYFRNRLYWEIVDLSVSKTDDINQNASKTKNTLVFIDSLFGKIVPVVNYRDHVTKALHEMYQFNIEHTDQRMKLLVTVEKGVSQLIEEVTIEEGVCQLKEKVTLENEVSHLTEDVTVEEGVCQLKEEVTVEEGVCQSKEKVTPQEEVSHLTVEVTVEEGVSQLKEEVTIEEGLCQSKGKVTPQEEVSHLTDEVSVEEGICQLKEKVTLEKRVYRLTKEITAQYPILDKANIVLVSAEGYTERDLEDLNKMYMYENEGNTSNRKEKKSEPILSRFCLPNGCHSRMTTEDSSDTAQDIIVEFLCKMANSDEWLEKEKYKILVSMLLNRFTLDGNEKLSLSTLRREEIRTQMAEMEKSGILTKRGDTFTFANDIILFAVVESVRNSDLDIDKMTKVCDCYCILQFFRPKKEHSSDGNPFSEQCFMSLSDDLETYSTVVEKFKRKGNVEALEKHELYQRFEEILKKHEQIMSTKHINKPKGLHLVRKMIQYHPYLREHYEKTNDMKSIKKDIDNKEEKFECCTKKKQ